MKPGHHQWVQYTAKVNALNLRERCMLFGSALLVVGALADTLVLSPARAEQQQIKVKLSKLSEDLGLLRAQVGASGGHRQSAAEKATPREALLAAIQKTQQEKRELDEQLKQSLASPDQIARLPDLMAKVMRQQPSLTLAKLATIAPDQDRTLIDKLSKFYQLPHQDWAVQINGVDVGVIGPYLELIRYLGDLERALPGLRWGELHVHAEPGSPNASLMELRVYLTGAPS